MGRYEPALRTYLATVDAAALDAIAQADFVLAVAPVSAVRARRDGAVKPNLPNDVLIFERVGHSPAAPAATGTADLARR